MAVTPIYSIPYVESSDLVANYPGVSESLAEQVEDKLPTYAATAPASPNAGQIWIDSDDDVPYFYDGTDWIPFPSGVGGAVIFNTPTGNYTDGDGVNWNYYRFTGSGTLTVTETGIVDLIICAGGGSSGGNGGVANGGGGAGGMISTTNIMLPVGSLSIIVGAGGAITGTSAYDYGRPGNNSYIDIPGGHLTAFGGGGASAYHLYSPGGSTSGYGSGGRNVPNQGYASASGSTGGGAEGVPTGRISTIDNISTTYCTGGTLGSGSGAVNTGNGGGYVGNGGSGIITIRSRY